MAIVKNKGGLMKIATITAGRSTVPNGVFLEREALQAIWQYHGEWIESLREAYINYVMLCLLESRKVQAMLLACPRGGLGSDIQLHFYIADTDQEIHSQPVILCHCGCGLFRVYSADSDRIKDVLKILLQVS